METSTHPAKGELKIELMSPNGAKNSTIFILGSTGSGKSELAANLIKQRPRFVIFDTKLEYRAEYFGKDVAVCEHSTKLLNLLNDCINKIIFKVGLNDAEFEKAMGYVYQFQQANAKTEQNPNGKLEVPLTVFADEVNRFAETNNWGDNFQDVIQRGRSFRIEKIFCASWFGDIPTWVRDTLSEVYAFNHKDQQGVDRLGQFGFYADDVMNLPPYHVAYVGKGEYKILELVATNKNNKR